MSKPASPTLIGGFVVGAVALAVIAVAIFGSGRLFRQAHVFVLYFDGDVNGLKVGAAVKFKGVEIGSVTKVLLNVGAVGAPDEIPQEPVIPVLIELDEERMREKGGKMRLQDRARVQRMIDAGLRAQLAMESFVTGLLYVKLDLHPGSPLRLINDQSVPYTELPTLPTPLEQAQLIVEKLLAKLEEVDLPGLVGSLRDTVDGVNHLVNAPGLKSTVDSLGDTMQRVNGALDSLDAALASFRRAADNLNGRLAPVSASLEATANQASAALVTARDTMQKVGVLLEPDSPVLYQLGRTLDDLGNAARAFRRLSEELERNPSAILRGKAAGEDKQ